MSGRIINEVKKSKPSIMENKKVILNKINACFTDTKQGKAARNSMGVSESFYDPHYLTGDCFTEKELEAMTETELNNLIK